MLWLGIVGELVWGRDRHCVDVRRRNARIDRGRGRANPDLIGNGMLLPNAIAGAVSVRPLAAGAASGLLGCTQMLFGAVMAQIAGHLATGATTAWPIIIQMSSTTVGCWLAYVLLLRKR